MVRVARAICVVISSLVALMSTSAADAATVQPIQGKVLINRGTGFQPATQAVAVGVGDSVMVSADGGAQVVYSPQCSIAVKPGNVVKVAAEPPCRQLADVDFESTRMNDGAPRPSPDKSFVAPEERPSFIPAAAIGVLVGLCVGDVICGNDPASGQ